MRKQFFILLAALVAAVSCSKENPSPASPAGPEMIDLGLSVKWASCNVGATKPEEYGTYFAWGDVVGQTWDGSKWSGAGFSTAPKYEVYESGKLKPEYDAACVNLGGSWRMPTKAEQQALIDNCTSAWVSNYQGTGVAGRVFTSKINGNSIFIPAAGYGNKNNLDYAGSFGHSWSSTVSSDSYAWSLSFDSDYIHTHNHDRSNGQTVRAVSPVTVTDICGNTYSTKTIGNQTWMGENLRCSKYDTESEAYKAGLTSVPTSSKVLNTPYCLDASDKSNWKETTYAGKLSDLQIAAMGYLYNWAATVGVADGEKQTAAFSGNRQGICPNGWHVPSNAEWQALYDYIYKSQELSDNQVGKYLKTVGGWYEDKDFKAGSNSYGFSAVPAGNVNAESVEGVGQYMRFWSATPVEAISDNAYARGISYNSDGFFVNGSNNNYKYCGRSVRCLKN